MATLPPHPNHEQLRHQAKDLLRAARAGNPDAIGRLRTGSGPAASGRAVSDQYGLAAAQRAVAREYGFASWARLKAHVDARNRELATLVAEFCQASIRDWTGKAARMLAAAPEIAGADVATAVILGDADRVRAALERDPALANRVDARWGWPPLHAVAASRWHRLDPARSDGLLAVARLLLDAGADPNARVCRRDNRPDGDGWSPLRCAVAGAAYPAMVRLLLDRGAVPDDHDLYLACFGDDDRQCLRLLLGELPNLAESTALAAPINTGDTETVRLLLAAGADPRRPAPADAYGARYRDDPPCPAVYGAVRSGCPVELLALLLDHGADPNEPGPDGRSPYRLATTQGRADLAEYLRRHGARDDTSDVERFLAACLRADQAAARGQLAGHPGLLDRLTAAEMGEVLVRAAHTGSTAAVALLLELGFPLQARSVSEDGGTALHAAAYAGSADVTRLLLDRGADLEARDTTWDSTPLEWAKVGSGERPRHNPHPDWPATVRMLLDAGASARDITLSPDDLKPASPEVARLLRDHGANSSRSATDH